VIIIGVHVTGMGDDDAKNFVDTVDITTGCASRAIRGVVAGKALAQVGTSVPLFGLSQKGKELLLERAKEVTTPILINTMKTACVAGRQATKATRMIESAVLDGSRTLLARDAYGLHVSSRIFELTMKGDQCRNLQELTRVVAGRTIYPDGTMLDKRKAFAEHVATFHSDAKLPLRLDYEGIVLMSAHQPNLFPYSGVVRKAVLVHAVAERLRTSSTVQSPSSFVLRTKISLKNGGSERHSSRVSEVETVRLACVCPSPQRTTISSCAPFQAKTITK